MLNKLKDFSSAVMILVLITLIGVPVIHFVLANQILKAFGYIVAFAMIDAIVHNLVFHFEINKH